MITCIVPPWLSPCPLRPVPLPHPIDASGTLHAIQDDDRSDVSSLVPARFESSIDRRAGASL